MSLVDVRFPELDLFLQRWRARLNRRWLCGEALAAWLAVGAAALPAAWLLPGATVWWAGVSGAAALAFAAWKYPRRLTKQSAAAWIDDAGATRGLFAAAADSLERERGFAAEVLKAADRARTSVRVRLPWRRLAWRGALALLVAGAGLLSFGAPQLLLARSSESFRPSAAPIPDEPPRTEPTRELSPGEAAKKLFPENPRLAALAEQALTEGGEDALRAMLQQALDAQTLPGTGKAGTPSPSRRGGSPSDQARPEAPEGDSPPQAGPGAPDGKGQPGEGPNGGQGRDKSEGSSRGRGDSGGDSGSGDPGKGRSQTPLGQVDPGDRRGSMALRDPPAAGLFEFALPGSGPRLPSSDTVAAARRSAESQLARTQPPLEYQSAIRDYFLSLAQEVSP